MEKKWWWQLKLEKKAQTKKNSDSVGDKKKKKRPRFARNGNEQKTKHKTAIVSHQKWLKMFKDKRKWNKKTAKQTNKKKYIEINNHVSN